MQERKNNAETTHELKYRSENALRSFTAGNGPMTNSIESLLSILKNEGYTGKNCPFKHEIALNLDRYEMETQKKGQNRDNTVDFVVCLEKDWLLMTEAKFNVSKVDNIKQNIKDKINHSRNILTSCDNFVHCIETVIVLLKNENFQQHSNRLRRFLAPISINIEPMNVDGFYEKFFKY